MNSKLFLQKLSDEKLKELIGLFESFEITGSTNSEVLFNYVNIWYDDKIGMEKYIALQIDVYREAAYRWVRGN